MWFWLFVTLAALCIGYRRQISARYNKWASKVSNGLQYESFCIRLRPDTDADIIDFIEYITVPDIYLRKLVEVDVDKLTRQELVESCPKRAIQFNSEDELKKIELKLDRDYFADIISKLKDEGATRDAYLKHLVREDMEYRKTHVLPQEATVS